MNIYDAIRNRKSVRSFEDKDVPEEILMRLLEAARLAPSAHNFQEWRFIIVKDQGTKKKLSIAAKEQTFIAQAPVVLVCCAETDYKKMTCGQLCYPIDVAIAIDHIVLCAVTEGLGTCWIGAFYEDKVKECLGIPEDIRVVELLPIGYPSNKGPVNKYRLPLSDIVKREKW